MSDLHIYWWSLQRKDGKENYGDYVCAYLARKLSGKNIVHVPSTKIAAENNLQHFMTVGSVLYYATEKSIVWGSGIIRSDENVSAAKFLSVRGPRTRQRLLDLGYDVPEVYGDPALLLPRFIKDDVPKKYKLGIIPHYVDYEDIKTAFANDDRVKVIDLVTQNVERTTREILECEQVISSSLHGVIVSQAYHIPALWVKFSDRLAGDNVKFYDYFDSVGIEYRQEFSVDPAGVTYDYLMGLLADNTMRLLANEDLLYVRKRQLLASCPFRKPLWKRLRGLARKTLRGYLKK